MEPDLRAGSSTLWFDRAQLRVWDNAHHLSAMLSVEDISQLKPATSNSHAAAKPQKLIAVRLFIFSQFKSDGRQSPLQKQRFDRGNLFSIALPAVEGDRRLAIEFLVERGIGAFVELEVVQAGLVAGE